MTRKYLFLIPILLFVLVSLTACGTAPASQTAQTGAPNVVATTTIIGDVVQQIGGKAINLHILLPIDSDPHGFQPIPQDIALVAQADVVFANGAGLETFLQPLLDNAGGNAKIIEVSDGISLLTGTSQETAGGSDPHVWMDPNNVVIWSQNIENALVELDPAHADQYHTNAQAYRKKLSDLDNWIQQQVAQIPQANRNLVTDHEVFGYFAQRYGFKQVGAVIPAYSTAAQPSAQELAALEDQIRSLKVKTIFVGSTVNPALSTQVATDTGTKLIYIYTGSLTAPSGPAPNYIDFIKYNVNAIVNGLK